MERERFVEQFRSRLASAGLVAYADALADLVRPSIRLVADPSCDHASVGSSRLGGEPDLPVDVEWPMTDGEPLGFVAQLNVADMRAFDHDGELPPDGMLSFFYDSAEQRAWGFDPKDRNKFAVVFSPPGTPLARRTAPAGLAAEATFASVGIRPAMEWTAPAWESYDVERLGFSRDELFAYGELMDDEDDATIHRLLGHPNPVQGDMQHECQLVTNGIYCGDSSYVDLPEAQLLMPGAADWQLLLQIDTEDQIDMMWGDVGRIYYWIRRDDLRHRRWHTVWLVLQCG